MQEKHKFGLVTVLNELELKNIVKSKCLIGCKKKHKDAFVFLETLIICDHFELIEKIGNWEIQLTLHNKFIDENNYPDWDGYQKIYAK